jgi:hypothetical protein
MTNEYRLPWLQQENNMDSVPEWMYPYLQQTSWYNQPTAQHIEQPIVNQGMFGGSGDDTGLVSFENPVPMTYEEQKADWANMQPGQEMFLSLIPGAMQLGNSYYDRPWDAGIYGGLTSGGNSGKGLFGGFFDNLFGDSTPGITQGPWGGTVDWGQNYDSWGNDNWGSIPDSYTDLGGYGYDTYSGMGGDVGSESPGGTGAGSMDSSGGSYSADDAGDAAAESDWT